jgi:hypothetical protein
MPGNSLSYLVAGNLNAEAQQRSSSFDFRHSTAFAIPFRLSAP